MQHIMIITCEKNNENKRAKEKILGVHKVPGSP